MSKTQLFDDESEEELSLTTETEYAKKYDKWREKEELQKLSQKYGSKALNSDGSESSDSEDESDEPPEISEEAEAQFLKTLSLLKTKDPRIYDPAFKCFEEEPEKKKTTTLDDSDDDEDGEIFGIEKKAEIVDDEEKTKTSETKEGKLQEYLTGQVEHIDEEVERDLAPLKALWSDPKLNEGEAFLRDYILEKRYLEDGDVGEAEDKIRDDEDLEADEERVEEQGKFERAYNFRFEEPDQEYLKRFPRTMNYIRPKDDRRSRKRAEQRTRKEEMKQRKMEEIARLKALKLKEIQEKLARIKEVTGNQELAFKDEDLNSEFDPDDHDKRMKEIFDEEYYGDVDDQKPVFPELDEELEIENWDKYQPERSVEEDGDAEGPHCEDEDFNMDADYDPKTARVNLLEEVKRNLKGKKRRNRTKKSKLAQLLELEKPTFVPTVTDKSYNEYMEEYYKMDCEDIIGGDLPTRFKYREAVPNDYGLTIEEILLADDKELTQWVPLKNILKHKPHSAEKGDVKTYAQKAADVRLKRRVLPSLFKDLPEDPDIVVPIEVTKKKKKKKKKNKHKDAEVTDTNDQLSGEQEANEHQSNDITESVEEENQIDSENPKKKHKNKDNLQDNTSQNIEQSEVEDNGELKHNNKKNKHENKDNLGENTSQNIERTETEENGESKQNNKEKKHKNKDNVEENTSQNIEQTDAEENGGIKQNKKKKKRKTNGFIVEDVLTTEPSQESAEVALINKKKKKKVNKSENSNTTDDSSTEKKGSTTNDNLSTANITEKDKNLKRKRSFTQAEQPNSKKLKGNKQTFKQKFKQNGGFKNKSKGPVNPLTNVSDERLKAFGLNPKKYKNFLHFKKY